MSKAGSASKVKLSSFDDLFGGNTENTGGTEQIINAKLTDLHTFKDHPFRVLDDEKIGVMSLWRKEMFLRSRQG